MKERGRCERKPRTLAGGPETHPNAWLALRSGRPAEALIAGIATHARVALLAKHAGHAGEAGKAAQAHGASVALQGELQAAECRE